MNQWCEFNASLIYLQYNCEDMDNVFGAITADVIDLLQLCQPNEPYTAIEATTVVNDKKYERNMSHIKSVDL